MSSLNLSRRIVLFIVIGAVVGLPAAIARVACLGNSCEERVGRVEDPTSFCSLADGVRAGLARGFYEGRSGDLIAVTDDTMVVGRSDARDHAEDEVLWPSASGLQSDPVPLMFSGTGIDSSAEIPPGTGLTSVAETIAQIIGIERPHPDVRSGEAIPDVATGAPPRLVVLIVLKGIGSAAFEADATAWPTLGDLLDEGTGTLDARFESIPADPVAILATIGTGGFASEHGIVGPEFRNNQSYGRRLGELVDAGRGGFSAIATVGDHLQERHPASLVGLVGTAISERGVIGGEWAATSSDEIVRISENPEDVDGQVRLAMGLMEKEGFGKDEIPDLLAVVVPTSSVAESDRAVAEVIAAARLASRGSVATIATATGDAKGPDERSLRAVDIERRLERRLEETSDAILSAGPAGFFLDQEVLAGSGLSEDDVLEEVVSLRAPDGDPVFDAAFKSIEVSFGRYC